jgi:hypothetical protein
MAEVVRVVPGYTEGDIYGRASDRVFGEGAQKTNERNAKLLLKETRDVRSGVRISDVIDYDLYGRGDPRVFGRDAHTVNKQEAADHLRGVQRTNRYSLRSIMLPSRAPALVRVGVDRGKLEPACGPVASRASTVASAPLLPSTSIASKVPSKSPRPAKLPLVSELPTVNSPLSPDGTPRRVASRLPNQEEKPTVESGTVLRGISSFGSSSDLEFMLQDEEKSGRRGGKAAAGAALLVAAGVTSRTLSSDEKSESPFMDASGSARSEGMDVSSSEADEAPNSSDSSQVVSGASSSVVEEDEGEQEGEEEGELPPVAALGQHVGVAADAPVRPEANEWKEEDDAHDGRPPKAAVGLLADAERGAPMEAEASEWEQQRRGREAQAGTRGIAAAAGLESDEEGSENEGNGQVASDEEEHAKEGREGTAADRRAVGRLDGSNPFLAADRPSTAVAPWSKTVAREVTPLTTARAALVPSLDSAQIFTAPAAAKNGDYGRLEAAASPTTPVTPTDQARPAAKEASLPAEPGNGDGMPVGRQGSTSIADRVNMFSKAPEAARQSSLPPSATAGTAGLAEVTAADATAMRAAAGPEAAASASSSERDTATDSSEAEMPSSGAELDSDAEAASTSSASQASSAEQEASLRSDDQEMGSGSASTAEVDSSTEASASSTDVDAEDSDDDDDDVGIVEDEAPLEDMDE